MKRLLVDGQVFQTPAWHRGMGKYSLELLRALSSLSGGSKWDSIEVVLSKKAESDKGMLQELQTKVKNLKIVELPLRVNEIGNKALVEQNRKVLDQYIGLETQDHIDYLILSLMQGEIFPTFPSNKDVKKALLFYDLIPLMFHQTYLQNPLTRIEYLSKIKELLRADVYLSISKTAANDLTLYLGIDESRVMTIDGGPIEHHVKTKEIKVPRPFILMPTGNDLRKNNRLGILGFNEFNKTQAHKYTLVVTSFFKEHQIKELSELSEKIIFTGNISGDELSYLYENTEALLFPSEYEGLGLPILEAVEKNKPVACSNISVFNEMSKTAFHYFDPTSIIGISQALKLAVSSQDVDAKEYKCIIQKYTWNNTAKTVVDALAGVESASARSAGNLAVFLPDPSNCKVGRLAQELHAELTRHALLTYYVTLPKDQAEPRIHYLPYVADAVPTLPGLPFSQPDFDDVVYHIANNQACAEIVFIALAVPGVLILHDINLEEPWRMLLEKGMVSQSRFDLEEKIDKDYRAGQGRFITSLISRQKAIIVFNDSHEKIVKGLIKKTGSVAQVFRVELPATQLKYPEAVPNKTARIGRTEHTTIHIDGQTFSPKTDFEYNELLAKLRVLIVEGAESLIEVVDLLKFDAMPFLVSNERLAKIPSKEFSSLADAEKEASRLDDEQYAQFQKNASEYVSHNSLKNFSNMLIEVINGLK